jgi:hypothetical protein
MASVYIPTRRPEDWRRLLASPERHWRVGRSAYELAHSWQDANGLPSAVSLALERCPYEALGQLELLLAIPERRVPLPGGQAPSRIDVLALTRTARGDLAALGVEGKESESFGEPIRRWLAADTPGRVERLEYLAGALGLDPTALDEVEYQLLHRTVATVLEAERFGAAHAVMLVHSFSGDEHRGLSAFRRFAKLLKSDVDVGEIRRCGQVQGVELYLGWIADMPRSQAHSGDPDDVLADALEWLRTTYREHRFFKERDVEARLQQRMSELFEERRLNWRVYENFRMPGKLLDLAVVGPGRIEHVALGIELKYEPAHARGKRDLLARKFPVVMWSEVAHDIEQLQVAVKARTIRAGYALLLDEGGYWQTRQSAPPFGTWQHWSIAGKDGLDPYLLVTQIRT